MLSANVSPPFQSSKNFANVGACALAFTMCLCPSSVRYCAFGRTLASDPFAWRIHAGLLPPSMTSVGTATDAQLPMAGAPTFVNTLRFDTFWTYIWKPDGLTMAVVADGNI